MNDDDDIVAQQRAKEDHSGESMTTNVDQKKGSFKKGKRKQQKGKDSIGLAVQYRPLRNINFPRPGVQIETLTYAQL